MHRYITTISLIRRHISSLKIDNLFTTREFLSYGSRSAIDIALWRMVKTGIIQRLARGVFAKANAYPIRPPAEKVAEAKAKGFGKQIASHGAMLTGELKLMTSTGEKHIFSVDASSSSFRYGEITIYLRKTCPRKIALKDTTTGKTTRAFWHMGPRLVTNSDVSKAKKHWNRCDNEEVQDSARYLPEWLNKYFLNPTPKWRPQMRR